VAQEVVASVVVGWGTATAAAEERVAAKEAGVVTEAKA